MRGIAVHFSCTTHVGSHSGQRVDKVRGEQDLHKRSLRQPLSRSPSEDMAAQWHWPQNWGQPASSSAPLQAAQCCCQHSRAAPSCRRKWSSHQRREDRLQPEVPAEGAVSADIVMEQVDSVTGGLLRSLVRQPRCSVDSCESQGLSQAELSALGPRFQEPTELRLASKMVMEPAGAPVLPPICAGECG